jgi:hypothetical protein
MRMFLCVTCKTMDYRTSFLTLGGKGFCSAECFHNMPRWREAKLPRAGVVAHVPQGMQLCVHRLKTCNQCDWLGGRPMEDYADRRGE